MPVWRIRRRQKLMKDESQKLTTEISEKNVNDAEVAKV